jgi:hypothetical protein
VANFPNWKNIQVRHPDSTKKFIISPLLASPRANGFRFYNIAGYSSKLEKFPEDKPQFFCGLLDHQRSIPNSHHTRVNISSRYESCLLTNRNIAALLPRGIQVVLRQSVDANLVIGSPCQESYCGNFSKLEKYPGTSP